MKRRLVALLLLGLLAGCASTSPPQMPRELSVSASPSRALEATAEALMESGYVIRHADASLGRLEAVFSRWPGYRVLVRVEDGKPGSRLELTATHGGRALPPTTLEQLVADIMARLAA